MPSKQKKQSKVKVSRTTKTKNKNGSNILSLGKNKRTWLIVIAFALIGVILLVGTQAATVTPGGKASWQRFPGDPNPKVTGKRFWGSGIGGNSDPSRHEIPTGKSLSVRRTFFSWAEAKGTKMKNYIVDDLANDRLPYVSTKTPKWADVASGKYDSELDTILKNVESTGGPVWLTFFHEPEDDTQTPTGHEKCQTDPNHAPCSGTAADWRNMQSHIRERMNALGTKNIAFMPTLMSWTYNSASKRTPTDYWVPGIWDVIGVDNYKDNTNSTPVAKETSWVNFVKFVEEKGIPYTIGEWGVRGSDAVAGQKVQDFWEWSFANNKDLVGYSYFDSGLNSPNGSWELQGSQLTTFQSILKDKRVMRISDFPSISPGVTPEQPDDPATDTGAGGDGTVSLPLNIGITDPKNGDTISGIKTVTAGPEDNVQSVSFRLDGVWKTTDSDAPFSWDWNSVTASNSEHTITIRARKVGDPGNVYTEKSLKVLVSNPTTVAPVADTSKPTVPGVISPALRFDLPKMRYVVDLKWGASTDNVGVAQYQVSRDLAVLANSATAKYTDESSLVNGKKYSYSVIAIDGSGNTSKPSTISVQPNCFLIFCNLTTL